MVNADVNYEYYVFDNYTAWNILPYRTRYYDYNSIPLARKGVADGIYSFPISVPSNNYGFRFSGIFYSSTDVQLAITSDDGGLLYVDGVLVVNLGGLHGPNVKYGNITSGNHFVQLDWFQGPYSPALNVTIASLGFIQIPRSWFTTVEFYYVPGRGALFPSVSPQSFFAIDCNSDGLLDVFRVGNQFSNYTGYFSINLGNGYFTPVASFLDMTRGSSWGDIDNDGDIDFITRSENNPKYINAYMNKRTSNMCENSGWTQVNVIPDVPETMALADIDGDGDLDVFANGQTAIWAENTQFGWISRSVFPGNTNSILSDGEGCTVADIDGDFDLDYIWNNNSVSFLYVNNNFTYSLRTTASIGLPNSIGNSENSDWIWGDCDADGDLDVFVASSLVGSLVYINNGTYFRGLDPNPFPEDTSGADWGDIDLDGDLDLVIASDTRTRTFLNNGYCRFEEANYGIGFSTKVGLVDLDNDGDLDAIQTSGNYWMNNMNSTNYFKIIPVGLGMGHSPKTPIGAFVFLRRGFDNVVISTRNLQPSYGSYQPPNILHFGLSNPNLRYNVEIRFPNKKRVTYKNCIPSLSFYQQNQTIRLVETTTDSVVRCHGEASLRVNGVVVAGDPNVTIPIQILLDFPGIFSSTILSYTINTTLSGEFSFPLFGSANYSFLKDFLSKNFTFTPFEYAEGEIFFSIKDIVQGNYYTDEAKLTVQIGIAPSIKSSSSESNGNKSGYYFLALIAGVLVIIGAIIAIVVIRIKRKKAKKEKASESNQPLELGLYGRMSTKESINGSITETSETNYQGIKADNSLVPPMEPKKDRKQTKNNTLKDAWEIVPSELEMREQIGKGAFGVVYKAFWRKIPVAVKQLSTEAVSPDKLSNFLQEISLMKTLRPHSNVILTFGVVTRPASVVTEYCEKGSLLGLLEKRDPNVDRKQNEILMGIALGMYHLHTESVVHRDLAARNVLMTSHYEPKISDFGMSRLVESADSASTTLTAVGPLRWMAPESTSSRIYSIKSDVWSYGILIIEIVTHELPYKGMQPLEVATNVAMGKLKPQLPASAPAKLKELLQMCCEFDPENRPDFSIIHEQLAQ